MKRKNIIIITGASSGMGREFVRQVDTRFPKVDELWLIARSEDKLNEIAASCMHKCRVLAYDLCNRQAQEELEQLMVNEQPQITMHVNSAGYGILGPFNDTQNTPDLKAETESMQFARDEQIGMVDLNCTALTFMTHLCIPYMKKNGRIIQLASSAAFLPQPKFAVYAATKSYVLSFCRALNEELRKQKIYITAVCPGPVDTEFFNRAEKGSDRLFIKQFVMAKPDKVVAKALLDARNKKEISVYSLPMQVFFIISKVLPHKFILFVMRFMK